MENKEWIIIENPPHKLYLTKEGYKNYKESLVFRAKLEKKLFKKLLYGE